MQQSLIKVKDLSLQYQEADTSILNSISFSMQKGEFIVLLGANGCGKSSLLKVLKGTTPNIHYNGDIIFDNQKINLIKKQNLALDIVSLNQNIRDSLFFDFTVYENIKLWLSRAGQKQKLDKNYLKKYLQRFNSKLALKLDTNVKLLSGGERQSLLLALCLQIPPKLLLLDEHTSALDPEKSEKLMALTAKKIKENNISCIMATHNLNHALKYGSRLIIMKHGEIVFDANNKNNNKELTTEELTAWYL